MTKKEKYCFVFCGFVLVYFCIEQAGVVSVYYSTSKSSISVNSSSSKTSNSNSAGGNSEATARESVEFDYPISRYFPLIKWGRTSASYRSETQDSSGAGARLRVEYQSSVVVCGMCSISKFEDLAKEGFNTWLREHKNKAK